MPKWHWDDRCDWNEIGTLWTEFPDGNIVYGRVEDQDGDRALWEFKNNCTLTWRTGYRHGKTIQWPEISGGTIFAEGEFRDMDDAKKTIEYIMCYGMLP